MHAAGWTILVLLVLAASYAAWAARPAIHPIEAPDPDSFDPVRVARGANLAAIGNCTVCHTAPRGRTLAGGRPIPTPFGTIHSTNITPDAITGIGEWSEEAFVRAMREGVDREGRHLYPVFPYDHFTQLSDEDCGALYAYLMTRDPVRAKTPPHDLPFPLNVRELVAAWKALYFRPQRFRPDPRHDAFWNRGAYLVQVVGHCGSCHTPRNRLGAEKTNRPLAGGKVQGWNAYALDRHSPAPLPWDADSLFSYLRHGWHAQHGIARGPMAEVTGALGDAQESDVRAIATYIASHMGSVTRSKPPSPAVANAPHRGRDIYESACAFCHDGSREPPFGGIDLALSTAVHAPNPRNIINVTFHGLHGPEGERAPIMPGFDGVISDEQMASLLQYLRAAFGGKPAWAHVEKEIEGAREAEHAEGDSWP